MRVHRDQKGDKKVDFEFTREQKMLQKMVADFSKKECEPEAAKIDETHQFPIHTWKKMADIGLLRINHSEKYGGVGTDPIMEMIVIEELSKASLTHGASYALLAHGFPSFIEKFGTNEQKEKYIPPVLNGEVIGGFCLTEPEAGSDAAGIKTSCRKTSNGYVLNGTKQFVTAGSISDYFLVVARSDAKAGEKGYTGFIVDATLPGVSIGKIENKMGLCALPTTEVIFEDVFVPFDTILGGESGIGKMLHYALATLDVARIGTGAQALGIAQAAYEHALQYSGERIQFGKPIHANQGIKWYLAEMASKLDASRLLVYRAAWMAGQGKKVSKEAAMCKLMATTYGREVVNTALQIYGGYGYMKDYPLERMYRDIKITEIYEGSSEIMKVVIAGSILPKK